MEKIQDGRYQHLTSPYIINMTSERFQNITKHHFQVQFDHRPTFKKFEILTQNYRLPPFEKIQDGDCPDLTSPYMQRITLV